MLYQCETKILPMLFQDTTELNCHLDIDLTRIEYTFKHKKITVTIYIYNLLPVITKQMKNAAEKTASILPQFFSDIFPLDTLEVS